MNRRFRRGGFVSLATMALFIGTTAARAGDFVIITGGGGVVVVTDQGNGDNDGNVNAIKVDFTLQDPQNSWMATGTVLATGGGSEPPTTIVTDLLIERLAGPAFGSDDIEIVHEFGAFFGTPPQSAEIEGEFDNLDTGVIALADLDYFPYFDNTSIGAILVDMAQNEVGPVPFFGDSGPVLPATVFTSHTIHLKFYLDTLGDSIRLFDSAAILSVPEPTTGAAMLALLVWLSACRRRRRAT